MKNLDMYMNSDMDSVTDLLGRELFFRHAEMRLREAEKNSRRGELQMLYLNICDFKMYNLHYGTTKGNAMLKNIGVMLRKAFPETPISRFSDDHFTILLSRPGSMSIFEKLILEIADLNPERPLAAKLGICNLDLEPMSAMDACDLARAACDSIKNDPDRNIAFFTPELRKRKERREYIVHNIDEAAEKGYLKVYYQPVFRAVTKTLCGAEALSRWEDPKFGFLSPAEFIPILEETRLITKLDQYVIRTVCRELRRRIDQGKPVVPVSVNVSKIDFFKIDLPAFIEDCMKAYMLPRRLVNIEVTESIISNRKEFIFGELLKFQNLGHRVIMDDFGSGYSSLNVLKDYPFDTMKLDMAFLSDFSERAKKILRCTIEMAKDIGASTIAEGVETDEQFQFLRDAGCEKIQGYYFCRPLPLDKLCDYYRKRELRLEEEECVSAYEAISSQVYTGTLPMAIFMLEKNHINFVYMSKAYQDELQKISTINRNLDWMEAKSAADFMVNKVRFPINRNLYQKLRFLDLDHPIAAFEYPISYGRVEADYHLLFSREDKKLILTHVLVKRNSAIQDQEDLDLLRRNLYYLYDEIYIIDLERQVMYSISSIEDSSSHMPERISDRLTRFEAQVIHAADLSRYERFMEMDTLEERIESSESGILSSVFMTRNAGGDYVKKVHQILKAQGSERRLYLYFIQDAAQAGIEC